MDDNSFPHDPSEASINVSDVLDALGECRKTQNLSPARIIDIACKYNVPHALLKTTLDKERKCEAESCSA